MTDSPERLKVLSINRTPSDFVSDTQHLSAEEIGAYQLICDSIVIRGQDFDPPSLPNDDEMLRNIARLSMARWKKVKERLCKGDMAVLTIARGRLTQIRVALEVEAARHRIAGTSKAGRASGEARRAKAELRERLLNGCSNDVQSSIGEKSNGSGTSHELRVTSYEKPSASERETTTTNAQARRVSPETEAWLRIRVGEIRRNPRLMEMAVHEPEDYIAAIRDMTGWSPDEVADMVGDDGIRPRPSN